MDRRKFLTGSVAAVTGIVAGATGIASDKSEARTTNNDKAKNKKLQKNYPYIEGIIDSAPCLQNFAETSIGISFAVSTLANGYVKYWKVGDKQHTNIVKCGGYRVTGMNDKCMQIRLTDLEPSTTYKYVIGAWKINYKSGVDMKIEGYEESKEFSFCTAGKLSDPHFCVINDTHENSNDSLNYALNKIEELNPAFVLWNGDACNVEENIDQVVNLFLRPNVDVDAYAANRPYLFCPGNHDQRGRAARKIEKVWMFRQPEERLSRDWDLGRNFAIRVGQLAIIGLDTGEDKRDKNKIFAGIFNNEAYRVAQKDWLEYALNLPDIKSAPFLIASCHIPLFDKNPKCNPGDVAPDGIRPIEESDWDKDSLRYIHDYTDWQRTCAELWTPLLEEHNCQLVISAHTHRYRYDAPTKDRSWAQIVGGGNDKKDSESAKVGYPSVIEVNIKNNKLVVNVYNAHTNKLVDTFSFSKRNTK